MKKNFILTILILISAATARAQGNGAAGQAVNLALSNAIEITFTGSGTSTGAPVTMAFSTFSNYSDGVESDLQQLKVKSNKNFKVAVKSNAAKFTYTGSTTPAPQMSVSGVLDVMVVNNNTGGAIANNYSRFQNVRHNSKDILTNCSKGGNQTFSVKYKATPGFKYPAGNYAVDVVYTATQL